MAKAGKSMRAAAAVAATQSITIDGGQSTDIGASQRLAVGANEVIAIGRDRQVQIGGSDRLAVKVDEAISVGGAFTLSVGKDATLEIGGGYTVSTTKVRLRATQELRKSPARVRCISRARECSPTKPRYKYAGLSRLAGPGV